MKSFNLNEVHWVTDSGQLFLNSQDYFNLLKLRLDAYVKAGKMSETTQIEDVKDKFDSISYFVYGKHENQVICSMRLIIHNVIGNNRDKIIFEHEEDGCKIEDLVDKKSCIEITRVTTHPDYRGIGLLTKLFEEVANSIVEIFYKYDKTHVLGSSTKNLLKLYTRCGFKVADRSFSWGKLGGGEHFIFVMDIREALNGVNVDWITYNMIVYSAMKKATLNGFKVNANSKKRLIIYSGLRPLAKAIKYLMIKSHQFQIRKQ